MTQTEEERRKAAEDAQAEEERRKIAETTKARLEAEAAAQAARELALAQSTAVLHQQAVAIQNFKILVPIVLDFGSTNFNRWRGLFLTVLAKYALDNHVLSDDDFSDDEEWHRMDATVKHWIYTTLTVELLELVMGDCKTARVAWLRLEEQFIGNRETRAMILDAEFRNFVQGDLSIADYCRRMKGMADALGDLGEPVLDRSLVLTTLRGLNEKFSYMAAIIKRTKPLPLFTSVRAELELEEIEMKTKPGVQSTAMVATTGASSAAPPRAPSGQQSRPSGPSANPHSTGYGSQGGNQQGSSNSNGKKNWKNKKNFRQGGFGSGYGSFPSVYNPWSGTIQMWPGPGGSVGVLGARPPGGHPQRPAMQHMQQQFTHQQPQHNQQPQQHSFLVTAPPQPMVYPQQQAASFQQLAPAAGGFYVPSSPAYSIWDQNSLAASFNTMTLTPPPSNEWVADSGASSHMTSNAGSSFQERDRQMQ